MISIVIPVLNEAENINPLYFEVVSAAKTSQQEFEVILVNDGSIDTTQKEIEDIFERDPEHLKSIQFRNRFGKAAALHAGFQAAKGEVIVTLDGDLQDDPKELPKFLAKLDEGFDLVSGWKQHRQDSFIKNKTSKIFNFFTNIISKVKLHDYNCGFKVYRAEVAKGLNLYGELHRYIPVLVAAQGYRVGEVQIEHRKRTNGHSKYNGLRFIHGFLDLFTVLFITRFRARPLHLFGYMGLGFFFFGVILGFYLSYLRLILNQAIGHRPLLIFSVMLMIMGVQIGVTGLVGEQITTMIHKNEQEYVIKTVLEEKNNESNQ